MHKSNRGSKNSRKKLSNYLFNELLSGEALIFERSFTAAMSVFVPVTKISYTIREKHRRLAAEAAYPHRQRIHA